MLGYPGLAVVGELGSDDVMLPWFLLETFLHLPFAILLFLVLVGPVLSGWRLSLLCTCKPVSAPLGDRLSPGTECCGAAQLLGAGVVLEDSAPAVLTLRCSLHSLMKLYAQWQWKNCGLTSKFGTLSKCGTACNADVPWQDKSTDLCGDTQLLGAGETLADCVPSDLTLVCSLFSWTHLSAYS